MNKNKKLVLGSSATCIFTICNYSYLAQAIVALESFGKIDSLNVKKIIFLVDSEESFCIKDIEIISMARLKIFCESTNFDFDFDILSFYAVTSLCTAIKPIALLFCRYNFSQYEVTIYTDPDTYWLCKPTLEFEQGKLYLFRHRDYLCKKTGFNGKNFLSFGGMNLGLIIDTGSSVNDLKHWNDFALPINLESPMLGYYTDQRPADLMVLSDRAVSCYDESVNLSYWNIADVKLAIYNENFIVNQFGSPKKLAMFHFSGYKKDVNAYKADRRSQYLNHDSKEIIIKLHCAYSNQVDLQTKYLSHITIKTNKYGTASKGAIYGYLFNKQLRNDLTIKGFFLKSIIKSKLVLNFIDRIYKIKNPLGIDV